MNPFAQFSRPLAALLLGLAMAFSAVPASAASGADKASVHGMTQSQVASRFGEPERRHAPVPAKGTPKNPPITRWDYSDFSVFFERDIAIHRVEHLKLPE
ncbi:MAG: hypothetical protein ACOC02_02035 [Guyparkeria sp.]|uniref:hypothetical protein n=1 Tax=Guyparkeria sp. TaxID=2035736 RepID=UPI00397A2D30